MKSLTVSDQQFQKRGVGRLVEISGSNCLHLEDMTDVGLYSLILRGALRRRFGNVAALFSETAGGHDESRRR